MKRSIITMFTLIIVTAIGVKVLQAGGIKFGKIAVIEEKIDELRGMRHRNWKEITATGFVPRGNGSSIVYGSKLYTFMGMDDTPGGGYDATGIVVQVYNASNNTWTDLADYPRSYGRYNAHAAEVNGMIYLFGGINVWGNYTTNTVDKYDVASNIWTKDVATLPYETSNSVVVTCNGKIYIMGLQEYYGTIVKTVYAFDPGDNSFTPVTTFQNARFAAVGTVVGDKIYIAGGNNGSGSSSAMEVYDIGDNSWSTLASMPKAISSATGGLYGGKIYIIGGASAGTYSDKVYVYDIANNFWQELPDRIIYARAGAFGGFIGDKYYLVGGSEGKTGSDGYGIMINKLEVGTIVNR